MTGRLIIEKDNITVNALGYSVLDDGLGSDGIYITNRIGVTVMNANSPILLENSSDCIIAENRGFINLKNSNDNSIANNSIAPPQDETYSGIAVAYDGLTIQNSNNNSISGNYIAANMRSVNLDNSQNNTIYGNIITKGGMVGIYLQDSATNTIIKNNIINNTKQVEAWDSYPNTWDDEKLGNYWSDSNNSTYPIKITNVKTGTTTYEYDRHAQLQPYTITNLAIPNSTTTDPTTTQVPATPNDSASPTQSPSVTSSPESTKTPEQDSAVFQTNIFYAIAGAAFVAIIAAILIALKRRR